MLAYNNTEKAENVTADYEWSNKSMVIQINNECYLSKNTV